MTNNIASEQTATRKYFQSGNLRLSYLDYGGESQKILLLLHGHMNDAKSFSQIVPRLAGWHIFSLDQRGHGWSEHSAGKDYSRESYIEDIHHFIQQELNGQPVVILGHSLGGVNAYQFAARYPELVQALIIEDIGAEINSDLSFAEKLPERSASLAALRESLKQAGLKAIDYFSESVFEDEKGWGFRADLQGMPVSQHHINGEWWSDWLASTCPVLLIHGGKSFILDTKQAELMADRRPHTKLIIFENCGHGVHADDPDGFSLTVNEFLDSLS